MKSGGTAANGARAGKDAFTGRLGRRLVLGIILISSAVTSVITAFELLRQYQMDVDEIAIQFSAIDRSLLPALTEAVWVGDSVQVRTVMNGIANMRDVEEVNVKGEERNHWRVGKRMSSRTLVHAVPLHRIYKDNDVVIGTLEIVASIDRIYARLWDTLFVILASNAAKTATVAIFMLYLFRRLIGRHLEHIARHVSDSGPARAELLALARPTGGPWRPDILDQIVASMNAANKTVVDQRSQLESEVASLAKAESEIRRLNTELQAHAATLEKRVVERTLQLEKTNRELETFSYSASHDLRAPLRAIQGFAQIIAQRHQDSLPEEARHYLDNIIVASGRMERLIEDLLRYSRLGREAVHLQPIALSLVLEDVVQLLNRRIAKEGARLDVAKDLPSVIGNASLLREVFTNLFDNALAYRRSDEAPRITVTWRREGKYCEVRVSDNGVGVAPQHLERIFRMFERLHGDEVNPGTGIGLAVVRKAVDLMRGRVWAESNEGSGVSFCVNLPISEALHEGS